ncbi:MAG: ATP-dependent RecD-like DNA helicase [Lachnospiraceae bacterium]|nr:ATP-dependent RecD-like DNA helicase [Lachnospiraceae bacterium]
MEIISGYVSHIIFRNDENGYTVFELTDDGRSPDVDGVRSKPDGQYPSSSGEEIVCVGSVRVINEGESVKLSGEYTEHQIYGEQFLVRTYEAKAPEGEEAFIRYLGSGAVKGVGPKLAAKIVDRFKEDTFRIIEEEPERLAEIKGISLKKARDIAVQIVEKQDLRRAMIFLQKYGLSDALSTKVYKRYGEGVYSILSENPYRLAEDIEGVGFKTADEIAQKIGVIPDSDQRIRCGTLYVLREALSEGYCYLPKDLLIDRASDLLQADRETVWIQIKNLAIDKKAVIREQNDEICVYDGHFYFLELLCAKRLFDLNVACETDEDMIEGRIRCLEKREKIVLDDIQRTAVIKAVMNGVTVITGGPGTGKTTIINMILKYFIDMGNDILLCAPTGRAAKRMSEATGYEAGTIQRLLHLTPNSGGQGFYYGKNEDEPLEADLVIVDEMSMVDISLFSSLLKALLPGTRLILVGDTDQLPSVGPGAVLNDIISSGTFSGSTVILKKIFRQAGESDIIVNAHKINNGEHISLDNKSRDFFFLERNDISQILNNIVILVRDKLPRYINASPFDVQVLTPMKKGALGVESLNPVLQRYLNPPGDGKKEKETGSGVIFREGDKVMQLKNNYQLAWEVKSRNGIVVDSGTGIFNGDMGIVKEISDFSETVTVEYDGSRLVRYPYGELDELSLAYAVTVHKSQGSEYPAVVMPLFNGPMLLFYRNLLYTGVTRAMKCVVLIGSRQRIEQMIDNADKHHRYTGLDCRLKELIAPIC